jgi:hypothetical protein
MNFKEWKSIEYVKQLKELTNNFLSIEQINQVINYLNENQLFNNKLEILVFDDPAKFMIEGFTEIFVGRKFNLSKSGEEEYNLFSDYTLKDVKVILNSSGRSFEISNKNNFVIYDVSSSGNSYGNYKNHDDKVGDFDVKSNIATIIKTSVKNKEIFEPINNYKICIYIGNKIDITEADIAISYILKTLKLGQT